jgi:predicted acylesterase/phospholipase RssA
MMDSPDGAEENALYVVFDGGGARGITHISAWRVLERLISKFGRGPSQVLGPEFGAKRYRLAGVAGTSSGAIAAAFIAAGAKSTDLIDECGRVPLFSELRLRHFYELFGIRGWRRLKHLRRIGSQSKNVKDDIASLIRETDSTARGESENNTGDLADSLFILIAVFAIIFAAGDSLYILASANIPYFFSVPYFLPVFWCALHISFFLTSERTTAVEREARGKPYRDHPKLTRAALHPIASVIYALLASIVVSLLSKAAVIGLAKWTHSTRLLAFVTEKSAWLDWLVFGLDGALIAIGIVTIVRRFLRGGVDTMEIEKDLNTALNALIAKAPELSTEVADQYVWKDRVPQTTLGKTIAAGNHAVTFEELSAFSGITLTVIAADTVKNEIARFSTHSTPDMQVAKAVAASLALPVAFHPLKNDGQMLVDGGIVSAIPAWVFRKERNHDPDCKILAIRIEQYVYDAWIPVLLQAREKFIAQYCSVTTVADAPQLLRTWQARIIFWWNHGRLMTRWPLGVFANTLYTAAFGARALELDASDRLESVVLQPSLGLLDFDISRPELVLELSRLELKARYQIQNLLWLREEAFNAACRGIEDAIRRKIDKAPQDQPHVRMFWAERDGDTRAVRIKHTYNFDVKHLDDRIIMPFGTSMSAFATETKQSQFATRDILTKLLSEKKNRYRAGVKWSKLEWCWAIPVLRTNNKDLAGVLAIESNLPLSEFDVEVGAEGQDRSSRWDAAVSRRQISAKELREIAFSSVAKADGRMSEWERDFARFLQAKFVLFKQPGGEEPQQAAQP